LDEAWPQEVARDARRLAEVAVAEDGPFDITSALTVAVDAKGVAVLEARSGGVLAGTSYADAVAQYCGLSGVEWRASEGGVFRSGESLGTFRGPLRSILRCERPLLNLLQRGCGIATVTRSFVDSVLGTKCCVLHTRKTLPGLRTFDVHAVLTGGAGLHRLDLARVVLVKDNHWHGLQASGMTLSKARAAALARGIDAFQVEVESEAQVEEACGAGATRILIDNQTPGTVMRWGSLARRLSNGIEIEATGGIDLANVRAYAEAGVDFVSVGALTHSVKALDIALEVSPSSPA
jgi:nicotinate-nucleotide pyrophosphorylase (carboxylating)